MPIIIPCICFTLAEQVYHFSIDIRLAINITRIRNAMILLNEVYSQDSFSRKTNLWNHTKIIEFSLYDRLGHLTNLLVTAGKKIKTSSHMSSLVLPSSPFKRHPPARSFNIQNVQKGKLQCLYRLGPVNSKSFAGQFFLRIKWIFELNILF